MGRTVLKSSETRENKNSIIFAYLENQYLDSETRIIAFGLFGIIAGILFYPFNSVLLEPQLYDSLLLRVILALLCFILCLKNYWPTKIRNNLPIYWVFTLTFTLPFFITFMMLKNDMSSPWILNELSAVILMMLLTDWLSYTIILIVGVLGAIILFYITTPTGFSFSPGTLEIRDILNTFSISIIMGVIFSRSKGIYERGKVSTLESLSASMAHELRTPLMSISANMKGVQKNLDSFIDDVDEASLGTLEKMSIENMYHLLENVREETRSAFAVIETLLVKSNFNQIQPEKFKICSMKKCINNAIERYPFDVDEKELISYKHVDFDFYGDELLMTHVIFNLIKNALYYIQKARKGNVEIWGAHDGNQNHLHFKDTGTGIPKRQLKYIFNRFYSNTTHGTGIGLTFCKTVMESFGGGITCESIEGEFAEFILLFPLVQKD